MGKAEPDRGVLDSSAHHTTAKLSRPHEREDAQVHPDGDQQVNGAALQRSIRWRNGSGSAPARLGWSRRAPRRIQYRRFPRTAWTGAARAFYSEEMRELRDVKKLDDRFGQFLVRVRCPSCGASRDIAAEALARLVGWSVSLQSLAPRLRCSKCGAKGTATVTPVGLPRPRGFTSNPH
jgi:hypothetical protein